MSDDLVKRLRGGCVMLDVPGYECVMEEQTNDLCIEAADQIEKLTAALRNVLLWADHCQQCDYDDDWAIIERRARAALEAVDD